jgi:hypothetical protein
VSYRNESVAMLKIKKSTVCNFHEQTFILVKSKTNKDVHWGTNDMVFTVLHLLYKQSPSVIDILHTVYLVQHVLSLITGTDVHGTQVLQHQEIYTTHAAPGTPYVDYLLRWVLVCIKGVILRGADPTRFGTLITDFSSQ